MLYFRDKIRAGTWESAPALAARIVLLNISVKICTSLDVENKSLFKSGANADAGARNSKSQGVATTSDSGRGGSSGIWMRDRRAVILVFYPGSHVRPNAEGIARNR